MPLAEMRSQRGAQGCKLGFRIREGWVPVPPERRGLSRQVARGLAVRRGEKGVCFRVMEAACAVIAKGTWASGFLGFERLGVRRVCFQPPRIFQAQGEPQRRSGRLGLSVCLLLGAVCSLHVHCLQAETGARLAAPGWSLSVGLGLSRGPEGKAW